MLKPIYFIMMGALILILGLVAVGLVVGPSLQARGAADGHYRRGLDFEAAEKWEQAADEYRQVIHLAGDYQDVVQRLAAVNAQGEVAIAQHAAATATAETLGLVEKHYQQGLDSMELGQWGQARAEFEWVITVDPSYRDVEAKLAEVKRRLVLPTPAPTSTPIPLTRVPPTATYIPTRTPSPTPTPAPTSTLAGPVRWYIRLYNIDDEATAYINDVWIGSIRHQPGGTDSGWMDVTGKMARGQNEFRFTLWNEYLGYTWGFQVKRGNRVVWTDEAGIENVVGADGDNRVREHEMIYEVRVVIGPDGTIISETP